MPPPSPLFDKRLLGTWKSDRRRTFQNYRFSRKATPASMRKLKGLFGKMSVRWTRKTVSFWFDGDAPSSPERYEVVAKDHQSVVVRTASVLLGEGEIELRYINFEEDGYWISAVLAGFHGEFFRKVAEPGSQANRLSRPRL